MSPAVWLGIAAFTVQTVTLLFLIGVWKGRNDARTKADEDWRQQHDKETDNWRRQHDASAKEFREEIVKSIRESRRNIKELRELMHVAEMRLFILADKCQVKFPAPIHRPPTSDEEEP